MRKGKQGEKYSHVGDPFSGDAGGLATFGFLVNALGGGMNQRGSRDRWPCDVEEMVDGSGYVRHLGGSGGGEPGDFGQVFPRSDAEDLSRGLRFIPGEVTLARRRGEKVFFVDTCDHQCCWHWLFQDGTKTYYFERGDFHEIARENGKFVPADDDGFKGDPGACKRCGNVHTTGGTLTKTEEGRKEFEALMVKFRAGVDQMVADVKLPEEEEGF